jgi:hypothetical protein
LEEGFVHLGSLLWGYVRHRWVLENSAVEELHDVEVGANDLLILTQAIGFGYRDICLFESVDDPVFAVDLVCCLESC